MHRNRIAVLLAGVIALAAAWVQPASATSSTAVFTGSMSGSLLPIVGTGSSEWSVVSEWGLNSSFSASGVLTGNCLEATGEGTAGITTPDTSYGGPVKWVVTGRTAVVTGVLTDQLGVHERVLTATWTFRARLAGVVDLPCVAGAYGYDVVGTATVTG